MQSLKPQRNFAKGVKEGKAKTVLAMLRLMPITKYAQIARAVKCSRQLVYQVAKSVGDDATVRTEGDKRRV